MENIYSHIFNSNKIYDYLNNKSYLVYLNRNGMKIKALLPACIIFIRNRNFDLMKTLLQFLVVLFATTSINCYAQQNSPIAGNAAALMDYLKKDYNIVDPDSRADALIQDRAQVITIFKSYLTDMQKTDLARKIAANATLVSDTLGTAYGNYANAKKIFESGKATDQQGAGDDLNDEKTAYIKTQYEFDNAILTDIRAEYAQENGFIASMIQLFIAKYGAIQNQGVDANSGITQSVSVQKSILSPGTDLSFSTYIDALAKFLAKRIKEELVNYVMAQVKKTLENPRADDPFAEFKVLLPRTTDYLENFNSNQILNFQTELRQYIQDDLNHILDNAPNLANTPRFKLLIRKYPEMQFVFDGLSIIPELQKAKYPDDYFSIIENSPLINAWKIDTNDVKHNIANLVRMSGLIAHSLQVADNDGPHFAGRQFFSNYGSEVNFYKLFFGFLYQQNKRYYDINFIIPLPNAISLTTPNNPKRNANSLEYHIQHGLKAIVTDSINDKLQHDKNQFMTIYGRILVRGNLPTVKKPPSKWINLMAPSQPPISPC